MGSLDAVFSTRGWLAGQPADFRRSIIACGRLVSLAAGAPVFRVGDAGGGIYGLVSGAIGCEATTRLSGPTLVHIMQAGWWFGEGPMLFDRPRTMSFVALEPVTVLLVPLQAIRSTGIKDADSGRLLGQIAEIAAVLAIEAGCDLLIKEARQRLAAVLLRVTAVLDGVTPPTPRGFRITQSQLAEMSNVSRHHANAVLLGLQTCGYIKLDYGRIAVLQPGRLADFVAGAVV